MTYNALNDPQHIRAADGSPKILINPGSGPVSGATLEHARSNVTAFLRDLQLAYELGVESCEDVGGGRYRCMIVGGPYDVAIPVAMPGLPLEQVRYMGEDGQNIWNFPRMGFGKHADDLDWVWSFALDEMRRILARFDSI